MSSSRPGARSGQARWSSRERWALGLFLVAALVLRLLHWRSLAPYPWFDFLGLDAKHYDEWALRILSDGLQGEDPYFMGPLYPHLLAGVYAVFGRSLDAVRAIQIVLSVASVGLVHLLGRFFGGPRLAWVASLLAVLYGPLVFYSVSILYPTLTVFLALLILLLLVEAARRRSLAFAVAAGVALGVYALGRGNILLFAPPAFLWLILAWGRPLEPRREGWRRGMPAGIALAAGTVLAILPATLHNLRTGDPTFLTTNGGLNLYIGNGPMASGGHEIPVLHLENEDGSVERVVADLQKDIECRREAELATGRTLRFTEVSDFWSQETLRFIRAEPGTFLANLVRKAYLFWSTYEVPQIEHFGYFRQFSLPLQGPVLSFALLGPLALVGMGLALRRPGRWALPLLFVAVYSLSTIVFFVLARYRLPVVPALLVFAAHGALALVDAVRARRWRFAGGMVATALALGWFMNANLYGIDERKGIAQILYRHGIVEDSRGNYEAAIRHYEDALRLKPAYDRGHLNLGVDLARLGRSEEALKHFRIAEEISPEYYRPSFNRGLVLEDLGRYEEAEASYRRCVELEPRNLLARSALGEMLLLHGDLAGAAAEFTTILEYRDRWEGEFHPLARARAGRYLDYLARRERLDAAGLGDCFARSPEFRLAEIARLRGRIEMALSSLHAYFAGGGACAEAYQTLGLVLLGVEELAGAEDALQRALGAEPRFPGTHLALGRLAAARGQADTALEHFRAEADIAPDDPEPSLETGLVHERLLGDAETARTWFGRFLEAGGDARVLAARSRLSAP